MVKISYVLRQASPFQVQGGCHQTGQGMQFSEGNLPELLSKW